MDKFAEFKMKRIRFYLFCLCHRWEFSVSGRILATDEEGMIEHNSLGEGDGTDERWLLHHKEGQSDMCFLTIPDPHATESARAPAPSHRATDNTKGEGTH